MVYHHNLELLRREIGWLVQRIAFFSRGIVLLLFGRILFWLFVGLVGFVVGFHYAGMYMAYRSAWKILVVGVAAGDPGAVIAVFLQEIAIGL